MQMARAYSNFVGKIIDGLPVKDAVLYHPQGAFHHGGSAMPCRRSWRGLGATTKTGAISVSRGSRGAGVITDVRPLRTTHRTDRTTINMCGSYSDKKLAVKA